ncbi:MAG: PilZ domain-containing protein [Defluviitaleaceae bacterium]|nr:PilZ domain-containing protein [Defluviitaleaceae bacterium]
MALLKDYTGYTVLIYSPEGEYLCDGTVSKHDKKYEWIELRHGLPPSLKVDDICPLLIMTSPSPCEYRGRVVKDGWQLVLALFKGKEKENRKTTRYKVNFPVTIENLIIDGGTFPLFEILTVNITNISRTGVRFSAPLNSLLVGDKFTLRMQIGEDNRLFTAIVVNSVNKTHISEYGCRLVD